MSRRDTKEVVYWDCEDSEQLRHETVDEAIEAFIDGFDDPAMVPQTIEVKGYRRVPVEAYGINILDDVLEALDEEYGDPDGDSTEPTPAMKKAEAAFLDTICSEYTPCLCEPCDSVLIQTKDWVRDWVERFAELRPSVFLKAILGR